MTRKQKALRLIITLCISFVMTGIVLCLRAEDSFAASAAWIEYMGITFALTDMLVIITAGICGYQYGLIVFLATMLVQIIRNGNALDGLFSLLIYFVISILAGYFASNRWYRKWWKSLLAVLYFTIILGGSWYIISLQAYSFSSENVETDLWKLCLGALPEVIAAVLIQYLFFRFAPDKIKRYIGSSYVYTSEYEHSEEFRDTGSSVLRRQVTMMTMSEAILLSLFAVILSNAQTSQINRLQRERIFYQRTLSLSEEQISGLSESDEESSENHTTEINEGDDYKPSSSPDDGSGKSSDYKPNRKPDKKLDLSDDQLNNISDNFSLQSRDIIIMDIQLGLIVMCIAMPLGMFFNSLILKRVVFPIKTLSSVMNGYFSENEEDRDKLMEKLKSIKLKGKDNEINQLNSAMQRMISDMTDHIEAVEREQQLESDLKVSEARSEAKSVFLSNMSHEIRTPINAVLGMNEMILRESREQSTIEYAENVRNAGNTLLGLVNDILDFSKIEAGKMDIIPVDYDLSSVLNDLVTMIQTRADDKGLKLEVKVDPDIPVELHGDEIRIKQVATNILTNAVKYTEKGSVSLNVGYEDLPEEDGKRMIGLRFSITDTGIGIKEEDMEKLFTAFDRIEEQRNRTIEGTGLGMNITQRLLSMMGSELKVQSEYGKGSTFSFTVKQGVVSDHRIGNYEESYRRTLAQRKRYKEKFTAPDAHVLVVDDTPMNLSVFRSLLKTTLVQIDTAESGYEGIELANRNLYDILFIDHMMPKKDGIETLYEIRAGEGPNCGTKAVCLTANAVSGAREKYISAGFDDYLTKPIVPEKLEQMIMEYLPEEKLTKIPVTDETSEAPSIPTVLVIDDDEVIRVNAEQILKPYYSVLCCGDGRTGVETAEKEQPDLILLDIQLTGMNGFDVLRLLRKNDRTKDIPVMFVTGDSSEETEVKGFRDGVSDFVRKPFVPEVLLQRSKRVIDLYHYQNGLITEVGRQTERADRLSLEMMVALSKTVDAKDHYTNGHSGRVADYSAEIARRMGKSEAEQEKIYEMGLMHDIGKIGVSEEIINKPARLTDEEFEQIKKHTVIGYDILASITEVPELATGARYHHEKYDGSGYPDGLKGKDIPEAARIICVADCYDAMTSTRTYSTPRSQAAVRAEIEKCSGTQFDPDISAVMLQMIDDDKEYKMNEQGGTTVWKNRDKLWGKTEATHKESELPEWLYDVPEIDTDSGIMHCGTAEIYLETLTIYAGTVFANADEIERYLSEDDLKDATVKIHALKSTSRVIGAADLGDLAERLEKAGNDGDRKTVDDHIDELLTRYRSLGEALSPLVQTGTDENDDRPEIGADELSEIYTAISEFMSVADFDSAADLIGNLKEYKVPDNEKDRCSALIKAADEVMYEDIEKILNKGA